MDGSSSDGVSLVLLILAAVVAVLVVLVLLLAVARRFGIGERRLAPLSHALREAAWRVGGTWEDFRDWLRTGR